MPSHSGTRPPSPTRPSWTPSSPRRLPRDSPLLGGRLQRLPPLQAHRDHGAWSVWRLGVRCSVDAAAVAERRDDPCRGGAPWRLSMPPARLHLGDRRLGHGGARGVRHGSAGVERVWCGATWCSHVRRDTTTPCWIAAPLGGTPLTWSAGIAASRQRFGGRRCARPQSSLGGHRGIWGVGHWGRC